MRYTALATLLLLITFQGNAQNLAWAKSIGGPVGDMISSATIDPTGTIYATGGFSGTVDFDPGPAIVNMTASVGASFIIKLDPAGNLVWAKSIHNTPNSNMSALSMTLNVAGGLFLAGEFIGTIDFDPGPGVVNHSATTSPLSFPSNAFVLKLDTAGNFAWVKSLQGTNSKVQDIKTDVSGNIIIVGQFSGLIDFDPGPSNLSYSAVGLPDAFILKLNNVGNYVWVKRISGTIPQSSVEPQSFALSSSDDIYVTGRFYGPIDFDPGSGTFILATNSIPMSQLHVGAFVVKLDSAGNFGWATSMAAVNAGAGGYSLTVDGSNNVYSTGQFNGQIDFDPGASVVNLINSTNVPNGYIQKLDSSGNFVWAKQIGGPGMTTSSNILLDANSNIHTSGFFEYTADFDPGFPIVNRTSVGLRDVYVLELNSAGSFISINTIGGSGIDKLQQLKADAAGNIYAIGNYLDTVDFDPGSQVFNLISNGQEDNFILKLGVCTSVPGQPLAITGNNNVCPLGTFTYSVTAVPGATAYNWVLPAGWQGSSSLNTIIVYPGTTGGNITVAALNGCGASSIKTFAVTVAPLPAPTITQTGNVLTAPSGFTSYQWYKNNILIPGATTSTYTTTQSGSYHVVVVNANNCNGQSNTLGVIVGIDDVSAHSVKVYPNPGDGTFYVDLPGNSKVLGVRVLNVLGQEVKVMTTINNKLTLEIINGSPGVYYLQLTFADKVINTNIQVR